MVCLQPLGDYSRITYGYSYIIGWVAVGTSFTAAILFLWSANNLVAERRRRRRREQKALSLEEKSYKSQELKSAYDYMNDPTVTGVYPYPPSYEYPTATYDPYGTKGPQLYPEYPTVDYSGYRY